MVIEPTTGIVIGFVLGWGSAKVGDFLGLYKDKMNHLERMAFFDKAITSGDPVGLYNLRVADAVSKDPRTVEAAVVKEVSRSVPAESGADEPWSGHALYGRCEIVFDFSRGKVQIFDPDGDDGPDFWEEEVDTFLAKFSDTTPNIV